MCGIICEICYAESNIIKDEQILQRIRNRGPNFAQLVEISPSEGVNIFFYGAILWMQGMSLTTQPIEDDNGILLYNGDIFDENWDCKVSDTQLIMKKLSQKNKNNPEDSILKQLKSLKGPYSIIYYSKLTQDLYFARDRIGRSTMLFHKNQNSIVISSILGRKYECVEVPATNIYRLNLKSSIIKQYLWGNDSISWDKEYVVEDWLEMLRSQQSRPDEEFTFSYDTSLSLDDQDNQVIKYIESTAKETNCKLKILSNLMDHFIINETVLKVTKLLEKSVKMRLERQPNKCKDCLHNETTCHHCTVGILFSGGLDCTILALLTDKYLSKNQSIDLMNVAFKKDNSTYDVPDRLTGRKSFEELKKMCPSRNWVFREVNVSKEELLKCQATTIADLVYPRQTILDESLGSALWFAARGQDDTVTSPCRVLILGSGADELFGGYIRHRNAFKRCGWTGLTRELQLDWKRISFRNLARDNRVICDHGRQPRMPYLDEDFTEFVLKLKPWFKCFPSESLGPGIGDKLMLRLVAFHLGLSNVVTLPKRALQFGSRIANSKEKGSDISKSFLQNNS